MRSKVCICVGIKREDKIEKEERQKWEKTANWTLKQTESITEPHRTRLKRIQSMII